jgi:hypothetical protein
MECNSSFDHGNFTSNALEGLLYSTSTMLQGSHHTYLTYPEYSPDSYIELFIEKNIAYSNNIQITIRYSLNKAYHIYQIDDYNEDYNVDELYEEIILDIIKSRLTGGE